MDEQARKEKGTRDTVRERGREEVRGGSKGEEMRRSCFYGSAGHGGEEVRAAREMERETTEKVEGGRREVMGGKRKG